MPEVKELSEDVPHLQLKSRVSGPAGFLPAGKGGRLPPQHLGRYEGEKCEQKSVVFHSPSLLRISCYIKFSRVYTFSS